MSLTALREKGLVLAEHDDVVSFAVKYVLHSVDKKEFCIGLYCSNRDTAFATWRPKTGLVPNQFEPFHWLKTNGTVEELEAFCKEIYAAWRTGKGAS